MIKVYLASPFFNETEIKTMERVKEILRAKRLDVFAPFENQNKHLEFGSKEWREATFNGDVAGIDRADVIVAIVAGNYCDSGTAWEIGNAVAKGKPVVIVNPTKDTINLMISDSLHAYVDSYEALEAYNFETLEKITYDNYVW